MSTNTRNTAQLKLLRNDVQRARVSDGTHMANLADCVGTLQDNGWAMEVIETVVKVPVQSDVTEHDRLMQLGMVDRFLTDDLREIWRKTNAPWSAIYEVARRWHAGHADRYEVEAFIKKHYERTRAWPSVNAMRHLVGLAPTRRQKGDQPGQDALLPGDDGRPVGGDAVLNPLVAQDVAGAEDNAGVYSDADPGL